MKTIDSRKIDDIPLLLTITCANCKYEGDIRVFTSEREGTAPETGERLKQWYEAGAVSGYGNVKAQETKVDPAVRDAREIPASEFSVSADVIAHVQDIWGASFFPTKVRAEPYKIHLHGPSGKFKAHRDTPEIDLVGTFLLGLGDTSQAKGQKGGALQTRTNTGTWTRHYAHVGSWVAFYPDVAHRVREIASGYRAVIAFKIFRQDLNTTEVPSDVMLHDRIKSVLLPLQKPYGILLQHHYSAGTAELNGLDLAALKVAAGDTGGDVKLLPVLIQWEAYKPDESHSCCADVFPMTEKHVDIVVEDSSQSEFSVDLKGSDAKWIDSLGNKSIPFYSPSFDETSIVWTKDVQDEIENTGNEYRPHAGDSI
ncbi:hypothetical protein C8R43DRAFT_910369 [Mycena crocata]|nr:hypothetical protein C8R43DRAFT_910369 [Mycena crocata]